MEINSELLAPCGFYCGVCGVYFATRDNNILFLEKLMGFYKDNLPGFEKTTIEDFQCTGCLSDNVSIICKGCSIKNCTESRSYSGCHECDDFPCKFIDEFPIPVGKKVILRAVPYRREYGNEKFVCDEEARYVCPECGNKLFRGAKHCNKCKAPVDLD